MTVKAPALHIRGLMKVYGTMTVESATLTVHGYFELACDARGRRAGRLRLEDQSYLVNHGHMRLDAHNCKDEPGSNVEHLIQASSRSNSTFRNLGLIQVEGYAETEKIWQHQVILQGITLINFRSLEILSVYMLLDKGSSIVQLEEADHSSPRASGMQEGPFMHIKLSWLACQHSANEGLACVDNGYGEVIAKGDVLITIDRYSALPLL